MNKKAFTELVSSVQDMGRHMRGGKVAGGGGGPGPPHAARPKVSGAEGAEKSGGGKGGGEKGTGTQT